VKANVQKAPSFIEPMKTLPVEKLPEGDWLYEIKHDGYRALAFKDGKMCGWSRAIKRRSITRNCSMP
jgi:ATP-dependent DNA ligase